MPSTEIYLKIINNLLTFPFATKDSLNLVANLIWWLGVITALVKTDTVSPFVFILRIAEHGPHILLEVAQIISVQSLTDILKIMLNQPSTVYRSVSSIQCSQVAKLVDKKKITPEKRARTDSKTDILLSTEIYLKIINNLLTFPFATKDSLNLVANLI